MTRISYIFALGLVILSAGCILGGRNGDIHSPWPKEIPVTDADMAGIATRSYGILLESGCAPAGYAPVAYAKADDGTDLFARPEEDENEWKVLLAPPAATEGPLYLVKVEREKRWLTSRIKPVSAKKAAAVRALYSAP